MIRREAAVILGGRLGTVVALGTCFFHLVEGWTWVDAYFFNVVTLSTLGYGNLVPATVLGKIGTTVFIFVGLGIFAVAIHEFGQFTLQRRMAKRRQTRKDTADN